MVEEEEQEETIMEEREALMVSPKGGNPSLRIAHFLKPTVQKPTFQDLLLPSVSIAPTRPEVVVNVSFNGAWRIPQRKWKPWFDQMHSVHQSKWVEAGIYEALKASTYRFHKSTDLVLGLARKWSSETNTFVFPWGEATVTLEDVRILGGFSVLGDPVTKPLEAPELVEIQGKMIKQRKLLIKSPSRRSSHDGWLKQTMGTGSGFEHEAFLALWLSRFVVPSKSADYFGESVLPVAVHLARGKRIALAPAVLASIYRDLGLIKAAMSAETRKNQVLNLGVTAPFQLLQLWAWERLPTLQPIPNSINPAEPRSARWNNVKPMVIGEKEASLAIDSGKECFKWRPYTMYNGKEGWVSIVSDLDDEFLSWIPCLRPSELVGLDCIKQYLPHRVSMQFGMDQDVPGHVPRSNQSPELAWKSYSRPIYNERLYIPTLQFEPGVTCRYSDWWEDVTSLSTTIQGKHPNKKTQVSRSVLDPKSTTGKQKMQSNTKDSSCSKFPPKLQTYKRKLQTSAKDKQSLAAEEDSQRIARKRKLTEVLSHNETANGETGEEKRDANGDVAGNLCENRVAENNDDAAKEASTEDRDPNEGVDENLCEYVMVMSDNEESMIFHAERTEGGEKKPADREVITMKNNTALKLCHNAVVKGSLGKEKRGGNRGIDRNSNKDVVQIDDDDEEGESSSFKVVIPKLEDRISKLEKVFAALEAAKSGRV